MSEFLILTGQSNGFGFGVTPDQLPAHIQVNDQVQIFNRQTQAFETMVPGVNTNNRSDNWGPEVEYAHQWAKDHPGETLYIVKSVEGSTGLAADPNAPDWSPESIGDVFDKTTARVLTAKGLIGPVDKVTLIHVQGEEDATSAAKAAAYHDNLIGFAAAARSEWGYADMQIVIAQIQAPNLPFSAEIRSAQEAFVAGDFSSVFVTTDGFSLQGDSLHLDARGQLDQGAAFYAATNTEAARSGTPGEDYLVGGVSIDTLFGGAGNDHIYCGAGSDRANGNQGDDVAYAGAGNDWMNGGQGNDVLRGEAGDDVLQGDFGSDTVYGGEGNDAVFGNSDADRLLGGAGSDTLRGGQGSDDLDGGDGADWLSGDLGADTLTGGAGGDVFHFGQATGSDRVEDFSSAQGDRIQLDAGVTYALSYVGNDTVMTIGVDHVVLAGSHATDADIFFLTA